MHKTGAAKYIIMEMLMSRGRSISRKDFLRACGTTVASSALLSAAAGFLTGCSSASEYIILKNGSAFINGGFVKCDILIHLGEIIEIDTTMSLVKKYDSMIKKYDPEIIDCSGFFVSPGWVDMHCHIGGMGLDPLLLGPEHGVTALVDAGTYGPGTFETFLESYYNKSGIPMYCFLNLRRDGIKLTNMFSANDPGVEDVDGARALASAHPHIIKGFKVRTDESNTSTAYPAYLRDVTARLGREMNLPVMYHLGDPQSSTALPDIVSDLKHAKQGDIITHFLRDTTNCALTKPWAVRPEVIAAKGEGVLFDVGHGVESFMFDTASAALDLGFTDFTISSDLHLLSDAGKSLTFANVASKFLALGMSIESITEKISTRPRRLLDLEPEIRLNSKIDLTLFSIRECCSLYFDAGNNPLSCPMRIYPEYAIVNGSTVRAGNEDRFRWPVV